PEKPRAGVVGLGQMGAGIARNLDKSGMLSCAFDLRPEVFSQIGFSDAVKEIPLGEMYLHCELILFAVPSTNDIKDTIEGANKLQGKILIDLTTSDPQESAALATKLANDGVHFLDAAMTGGAAGADAGNLTLMIGGKDEVVNACEPVLRVISKNRFHLGSAGSGHAMKLIHNMILHTNFLANCEGLQLARKAGIDLGEAVAVLNAGNARSFVSEVRFPRDILNGSMNGRSKISNLEKDLGLAVEFAERSGAMTPFGTLTRDVLGEAVEGGQGDRDFTHLFPEYEVLINQLGRNR
ncbi:MAG: NAD(P)-dependent oxidoreductase, partial [Rhizobiaceae bacterium]